MRTDVVASLGRPGVFAVAVTTLVAGFLLVVRPWYLHWGATPVEAAVSLPGDELLAAESGSTRAITVDAPAALVWQWLAMLGQDRGGFFSYELLEDLVGAEMENRTALDRGLPPWRVGDKLWMYPADKLGGAGHAVVLRVDPERALVFGTWQLGTSMSEPSNGTWAFILQPISEYRTRLIVRGRAAGERPLALAAVDLMFFEPIHFVMERKMLDGIKARVEGRRPRPLADVFEVVLFASGFVLFVIAGLRLLGAAEVRRSVIALLLAGVSFQLLTFRQPPWTVGLGLVLALSVLMWRLQHPKQKSGRPVAAVREARVRGSR